MAGLLTLVGCLVAATVLVQLLLGRLVDSVTNAPPEPMPRRRRQLPPLSRAAVRVRLEHWQTASRLRDTFSCVSMDWWPAEKCDYGMCPWSEASALTADLEDPLLLSALRALAPLHLRIGGSLADQLVFTGVEGAPPCEDLAVDQTRRVGFRGGCLPFSRWLALLDLCDRAGCGVLFSVNALHGRRRDACRPPDTPCRRLSRGERPPCCTNYSGGWDSSNLDAFLRATAAAGRRPAGIAYGNELAGSLGIEAHLPPEEYAREFLSLRALVDAVWPSKQPLLLAPDASFDSVWVEAFLSAVLQGDGDGRAGNRAGGSGAGRGRGRGRPPIDLLSYHVYPLGAGDGAQMLARSLDVSTPNAATNFGPAS